MDIESPLQAYQFIQIWAMDLFEKEFQGRWASGFIHTAISENGEFGYRGFVSYRSGKGSWITFQISSKARDGITYLIRQEQQGQTRINSVRIYLWPNRPCEYDYLTDPTILGFYPIAPIKVVEPEEETLRSLIVRDCLSFLDFNEVKSFRYAVFEFHRLEIRICGTVRIVDLYGQPYTTEFNVGENLQLILIRFWAESQMKDRHKLQISFDEEFMLKIEFADSYILKILEEKGRRGSSLEVSASP